MQYSFQVGSSYTRRDVYRNIGIPEDTHGGIWDTGYARHENSWFIFCNIATPGQTGHDYSNQWIGDRLEWYGKTNSKLHQPSIQSILSVEIDTYIFWREDNKKPFTFAGIGYVEKVEDTVPETPSLDQYWPDVEGTAHQDTLTELFMPPGTFFDSCPIHAITTATLNRLQELYPAGKFDSCRFRPNLLIDTQSKQAEFAENSWVGQILIIGDSVSLKIDTLCPRCVVTTLAQAELPQDLDILRTAAQNNNVNAGIRLSVIQGGTVSQGDPVWVLK